MIQTVRTDCQTSLDPFAESMKHRPDLDAENRLINKAIEERAREPRVVLSAEELLRAYQIEQNDPGFLARDMRMIVLAGTLDGTLDSLAKVVVASGEHAGTWSLESVQGDPVGIGWECRARRVA